MSETKRIRWHDEPETGEAIGCVGTLEPAPFHSTDELKAEAERWLERFVSSLGASFPEPVEHVRQPLRMVGRQPQPRLCSCGELWPCNGGPAGEKEQ